MRRLSKSFGDVRALTGVDLCVSRGEVVGVVGPNGSGKSTLLGVAAGLVRADGGSAFVAGAPVGTRAAARGTALVPDEPSGLDELTVWELLVLLAVLHGASDQVERRRTVLTEAFELAPLFQRRLGELSRGQRRRAALVAALQLDAQLVLVDEATATLDADSVGALQDALVSVAARGAGVLLATHDRRFLEAIADDVVTLDRGALVPDPIGRCREPVLV